MRNKLLAVLILSCGGAGCQAERALNPRPEHLAAAAQPPQDFVVMPGPTNVIQFRLYTNGSPESAHLLNTFDLEAYGDTLLQSPGGDRLKRCLEASPSNALLHNILVDGEGPVLASTNSMTVMEQASGPDWHYIALDASAAYRGRLDQYKRALLFVEPDLFVVHDHLVAKKAAKFQMVLHPPAATRVDGIWHDLRLDWPKGGFQIHAPARRRELHAWERIDSPTDSFLTGTVTMQLGPTNTLSRLDLLTVFALHRGDQKKEYAFRLLESDNAVGARIHRDGLPTMVAFKTDAAAARPNLTGFAFSGPVSVDVFKPKRTRPQ